jgi:ABC-type antimicrobial peptide transport system permease subunit
VQPEIYFALRQVAQGLRSSEPTIVLRTASDPDGYVPTLKRILREEDAKVVVDSIMTMEDRIATNLARPRLYAMLLGTFAVFALAITGVGLFGVLSYSVAQRMREIAVRTAIGAKPSDIVRMLLKQALTVTVVGLSGGALVSLAAGRYLSTFLYGISAYDPLAFALAAILVMVVTIVACVAPAHRAVRIDPMRKLRG